MTTILSVILIIFGILQIMLFFKIWVMTDDVSFIKNKNGTSDKIKNAQIEYMKGNLDRSKDLPDRCLYEDIMNLGKSVPYNPEYLRRFDMLENSYKALYDRIGLNIPNIQKYKDKHNLPNYDKKNVVEETDELRM